MKNSPNKKKSLAGSSQSKSATSLQFKTTQVGGLNAYGTTSSSLKGKSLNGSQVKSEKQGPIDWSHMGIKLKYRGEKQREDAYQLYLSTKTESLLALEKNQEVIPIVKVDRHPVYTWYYERLAAENNASNTRTKSRLLMKRFVFDVQELWLSNLEHLKEHQAKNMLKNVSETQSGGEAESDEDFNRGEGIANRRDVKEILNLQHQVQSVSQKRAFAKAYHTTRIPPPNVRLDYVPDPTPMLQAQKPLVPAIELILGNICFSSGNEGIQGAADMYYQDKEICGEDHTVAVHMDRLLPSKDFAKHIVHDVTWRITLIDSISLSKRIYVCSETAVALHVADLINAANNTLKSMESEAKCVFRSRSGTIPIPFEDGATEWTSQIEISVSSQPLPGSYGDLSISPIRITITAALVPFQVEEQSAATFTLILQVSPAEVQHTLQNVKAPLFDLKWWLDDARKEDTWVPLCSFLRLEKSSDDSIGSSAAIPLHVPAGLVLSADTASSTKSTMEELGLNKDEFLSPLQAAACAYELLPYMRLTVDQTMSSTAVPCLRLISTTSTATTLLAEVASLDSEYPYNGSHAVENNPIFKKDWKAAAKTYFHSGRWEKLLDQGVNMSLKASGAIDRMDKVPGGSEIGRHGLWFADHVEPFNEKTQVGAAYFRDALKSSTDSILVNLTLALETAILSGNETSWTAMETFAQYPAPSVGEEVQPNIPPLFLQPISLLLKEHLKSPLEQRLSNLVMIFSKTPIEGIDYISREEHRHPIGFKRYIPFRNSHGFREQIQVKLLGIDEVVNAQVYGITRLAATANTLGVNSRNIWHNFIAVNEHINRPRTSKDYLYIISNSSHRGPNIPTSYTTRMKANELVGLTSSAFKDYEDAYAKIMELRDVFNKQLALDARIEKVENDMKVKEAMKIKMLQKQLQRALEKKLRKVWPRLDWIGLSLSANAFIVMPLIFFFVGDHVRARLEETICLLDFSRASRKLGKTAR